MSKAVIATGGKQYIVAEGDTVQVELLGQAEGQVTFEPLLIIDGESSTVGTPTVAGSTVTAEIVDEIKADKVTSIRYKAKKRVHKLRGHRQRLNTIRVTKIG